MAEFWGFDQIDVDGLVFTSYNSLDWKRVKNIALELRKLGVPVWYDYGLEAGKKDWETQIARHIRIASVLVIFVTEGIFQRKDSYVMWEYNKARNLDIPAVPVFLDSAVATDSFYKKWAKEFPDSFDMYSTNLDRWKLAEGIVCTEGMSDEQIAAAIKQKLDRSREINYTLVPFVDKEAEMKKKAEEAKRRAELEEKKRQEEEAKQKAEREAAERRAVVMVGAKYVFGSYPQSTNAPEPITWRVLAVENGRALMISEDLLDCKRFDAKRNNWRRSELRAWLNGEFKNMAFSAAEQRKLVPYNGDYVTCLSVDEAEKYFSDATQKQKGYTTYPDRMAKPTAYARKNGCNVDSNFGTGWWWLRSPGDGRDDAAIVHRDGDFFGGYVDIDWGSVRPALWLNL